MIPASLIALEFNVPMIDLQVLIDSEQPEIPVPRRGYGNRVRAGEILVVDDTCATGRQVDRLRQLIRCPVKYVAIYVEDRPVIRVDYLHSKLPDFHQFYEWTMFHDHNNKLILTDMDGVLCEDWTGGNEDDHLAEYQQFLENARPRRIPTQPLKGIVTNRLERHRPETEAWLRRYGIEYGRLMMSPHPTFAARDRTNDGAARKAAIYQADKSALIFVESDDAQAREISRRTGRPVFSVARNGLV